MLVAAIRHGNVSALPNPAAHAIGLTGPGTAEFLDAVQQRVERVTHDAEHALQVRAQLQHRLDRWGTQRKTLASGVLGYKEATDVTGLLREPDAGSWDLWSAPLSLREVEPEVALQLDRRDRSLDEQPPWIYSSESPGVDQ